MNNLPINDEMNIIRRIARLDESTQNNSLTEAQINELASLTEEQISEILTEGGKLEAFFKMIQGLARKLRPTQPVELPPLKPMLPAPSLPQSTTIVPKGFGVWEPIPQPKAPSNLLAGLRDIGVAAGLGTLGYLGTRKKEESQIDSAKISPTSPSGMVDTNKSWTPSKETAATTPSPAPATTTAVVAPVRPVVSPTAATPAPSKPTTTVAGVPAARARGQNVPTRADEPNIPITVPAKPVEQPMDVAAEAAKLRAARFAAEKTKATPEQAKQVEDSAKRLGVEPWTQEHYDAVSKSIEQRKQAIQTAQKDLQTSQPTKAPQQPRDVSNIVPGSQMWGELSASERQTIRDRYARGEGPSISIRYNKETGKFDEPGYGEQGRYGDIVKALNVNESVLSYCNFINEALGINRKAYAKRGKGPAAVRAAKQSLANSSSGGAGDSTIEAPDLEPETTERPHIDDVVAPHISTLIAAADKHQIDLSHGEAFDPRSKDHQMLLRTSKDPEVHAASKKIGEIRSEYGVE